MKFSPLTPATLSPVSYTHLDVYKRQVLHRVINVSHNIDVVFVPLHKNFKRTVKTAPRIYIARIFGRFDIDGICVLPACDVAVEFRRIVIIFVIRHNSEIKQFFLACKFTAVRIQNVNLKAILVERNFLVRVNLKLNVCLLYTSADNNNTLF